MRCHCWCQGALHGIKGAANRQALQDGLTTLEEYGFKKGETAYIQQNSMKLEGE